MPQSGYDLARIFVRTEDQQVVSAEGNRIVVAGGEALLLRTDDALVDGCHDKS